MISPKDKKHFERVQEATWEVQKASTGLLAPKQTHNQSLIVILKTSSLQ